MSQIHEAFEVLGVARDRTVDEANRALRKLALINHADKVPADQKEAATQRMALLNAAFDYIERVRTGRPQQPEPSNAPQQSESYKYFLNLRKVYWQRSEDLKDELRNHLCKDLNHQAELERVDSLIHVARMSLFNKIMFEASFPQWFNDTNTTVNNLVQQIAAVNNGFRAAIPLQDPTTTLGAAATNQENIAANTGALNRKIEKLRDIIMKRTTSLTGVQGLRCLYELNIFAHSLENDPEKEDADELTELVDVAARAVRKYLKELERYANSEGDYSSEEVRLLNRTIADFVIYETRDKQDQEAN